MQLFNYLAVAFVLSGIASAVVIAIDLRTCPQPMRIMNSVWVLTGLWASVFGLGAYYLFGRTQRCHDPERSQPPAEPGVKATDRGMQSMAGMSAKGMPMDAMPGMRPDTMPAMKTGDLKMNGTAVEGMQVEGMQVGPRHPAWQSVVLSTLHCGAGCTLADLIGEWFLFLVPVAVGGSLIAGTWIVDYVLALVIGIGFQYAAIRGMERIAPHTALARAAKADVLSLTAWQAGMYGWMAVVTFGFGHGLQPPRDTFYFWFMMQVAMACGFLVALPVNILLIRAGIKKAM